MRGKGADGLKLRKSEHEVQNQRTLGSESSLSRNGDTTDIRDVSPWRAEGTHSETQCASHEVSEQNRTESQNSYHCNLKVDLDLNLHFRDIINNFMIGHKCLHGSQLIFTETQNS